MPDAWLGEGATSFRYYVSKDTPLFGFGGLRAIAATRQARLGLEIQSEFGFGRFHDVIPLARAMLIRRNLRATKAIHAPLSDATVTAIAQAIGGLATAGDVDAAVSTIEASVKAVAGV